MQVDTSFIAAGGCGERLRPLTDNIPKPMVEVNGKPVLQHVIEWQKKFGIKKMILGLRYKPETVKEYFGEGSDFGVEIIYSTEKEPLSDGGALKLAEQYLPERFLFSGGDIVTDLPLNKFFETHEKITLANNGLVTAALYKVPKEEASLYGIAKIDGDLITEFVEKPKEYIGNLANTAIYVLEKQVLDLIPEVKFCHLASEVITKLVEQRKVYQFPFSGYWIDIGGPEKLGRAKETWKH